MQKSPVCTAGIFVRNGKVLLGLRNYKQRSVWTTPGGRCDQGENVEVTLRREVREEIGINNFEIQEEFGIVPGAKEGDQVHVFLCMTHEKPVLMEPEKFAEWKWFDLKDIPNTFINHFLLKIIQDIPRD